MKAINRLAAALALVASAIGCNTDGDIVSEQFEHGFAESWTDGDRILTRVIDDNEDVVVNAEWALGGSTGEIEMNDQSVLVQLSADTRLTAEQANRLAYEPWAASHDEAYERGPFHYTPPPEGGRGGGGGDCTRSLMGMEGRCYEYWRCCRRQCADPANEAKGGCYTCDVTYDCY